MPRVPASKEDFKLLETIGAGTYGRCQKIQRKKDGKMFVWKEIPYGGMSEGEKVQLVREVNLLREFKHTHIVRYHDRIIDRGESTLYIIMEFCEGGDLASLITTHRTKRVFIEEAFVWKVLQQLLLALQECHQQKTEGEMVLHRDIKPANVFLDADKNVKLGDFGLARILHNTSLAKTFVGTPYYMSPEQLCHNSYDQHSDMWSLGCLVYELCSLVPPFTATSQHRLTVKVCEGKFKRIPSLYSDELQDVITGLLHTTPTKRPGVNILLSQIAKRKTQKDIQLCKAELAKREEALRCKEAELKQREEAVILKERHLAAMERKLNERCAALQEPTKPRSATGKENSTAKPLL